VASLAEGQPLSGTALAAFSGIAKPDGFFETLSELGYHVLARKVFRDHYPFRRRDLDALRTEYPGVPLVCTEKDAVKIDPSWAADVYVLRTSMRIHPADAFFVQLSKRLLAHKRQTGSADRPRGAAGM